MHVYNMSALSLTSLITVSMLIEVLELFPSQLMPNDTIMIMNHLIV